MDVRQRVGRLESAAVVDVPILVWQGERPAEDVMREAFGDTGPPPGRKVILLRWAGDQPDAYAAAPVQRP